MNDKNPRSLMFFVILIGLLLMYIVYPSEPLPEDSPLNSGLVIAGMFVLFAICSSFWIYLEDIIRVSNMRVKICSNCNGRGYRAMTYHFLPKISKCDECNGAGGLLEEIS